MLIDQFHVVSSIVAPPPTDLVGGSLTALQCFSCLRGLGELTKPMKYSKFADEGVLQQSGAVSSLVGFLLIYAPAFLVASYFLAFSAGNEVTSSLLAIHFGKRLLEAMVLHDFSGSKGMQISDAMKISSYYAFVTLMIASYAVAPESADPYVEMLGFATFAFGEIGNLYHHWLLKELKEERASTGRRYVPPRGGLFHLVATPHYLFEVVSWIGVALVAQQFNAYLEIISALGYLAVRSKRTNEIYCKSFSKEEWPRFRKNMIPLIF